MRASTSSVDMNFKEKNILNKEIPSVQELLTNKQFEIKINEIYTYLNIYLNQGFFLPDIEIKESEENLQNLFNYLLNKTNRNKKDLLIIQYYLMSFPKYSKNSHENINLIKNISMCIKYEEIKRNKIVSFYGENNEKFYIILEGEVTIFFPKEYEIFINMENFYSYLKDLYRIQEYGIINQILNINESLILTDELKLLFKNINKKNLNKNKFITNEEYLNRIEPKINEKLNNKVRIKILKYELITTLKKGENFGELNLSENEYEKNGTIITKTNCIFGTIKKVDYENYLKIKKEKKRILLIRSLLSHSIFIGYSENFFIKNNFFNFFVYSKINQNQFIFKQNFLREKIFFIIEGEIEISADLTINNLNNIIHNFNNNLIFNDYKNLKYFHFLKYNQNFKEFYKMKHNFKLFTLKNKEILGLNDFVDKKTNKFLFNAKIKSFYCKFFSINFNILETFLREIKIRKNYEKLINEKINVVLNRLINLKENVMNKYLNNIKTEENRQIEENIKIQNSEKIKEKMNNFNLKTENSYLKINNIILIKNNKKNNHINNNNNNIKKIFSNPNLNLIPKINSRNSNNLKDNFFNSYDKKFEFNDSKNSNNSKNNKNIQLNSFLPQIFFNCKSSQNFLKNSIYSSNDSNKFFSSIVKNSESFEKDINKNLNKNVPPNVDLLIYDKSLEKNRKIKFNKSFSNKKMKIKKINFKLNN